jgi:hypothetical protein
VYGQKAMQRVNEIEAASRRRESQERDASGEETQESSTPRSPDKPRRKTREQRLLEDTIPLGPAEESDWPDTEVQGAREYRDIYVVVPPRFLEGSTGAFLLGAGTNTDADIVGSILLPERPLLTPHLPSIDPHLVRNLENWLEKDPAEPEYYVVLEGSPPGACLGICNWEGAKEKARWHDVRPPAQAGQFAAVLRFFYGVASFEEFLDSLGRQCEAEALYRDLPLNVGPWYF